jgi:DeoR family glycerol-3-phosphate regulon repressor
MSMSLILRQQKTLELVRERGYISIEELAQHFDVTPQTIRRDINQLADEGLLRRYHGGAAHDSSVENTEYTIVLAICLKKKNNCCCCSSGCSRSCFIY